MNLKLLLFCLLFPLFLLLLSYKLTLFFTPLTSAQENTIQYLQGKVRSEELALNYSAAEISHLQDVQKVMAWVDVVFMALFLAVVGLLIIPRMNPKMNSNLEWKSLVRWGGIVTVALTMIIIIFLLFSFNSTFTIFHLLFFPQGNWLFPEESLLIQTFPQEFFVVVSGTIIGIALLLGTVLWGTSRFFHDPHSFPEKFYKQREITEQAMEKEIKRWWEQAKSDLKTAEGSVTLGSYDWASFQAQQAAEKALKALYVKEFKELRKIHDLIYFAKKLNAPESIINACDQLSKVYIETRYPETDDTIPAKKFTKSDAENFISLASTIFQWLEKRL